MKTIILTLTVAISSFFANAQSATNVTAEGTTITVTVPVSSADGTIIAALYDENTFMKAAPLQGVESKIENGVATLTFTNVASGSYGITLFHDKNGNKIMDFEANGMPKEMYGVSNNIMSYGPPQWNDAKFEVASEPISMEIRM
jgi:uncharacterized protein (DUF2141 family)|tara:strand:+ start:233 stop:664 length:432 start_codon:yes stop_codon:yes gene_type:complete